MSYQVKNGLYQVPIVDFGRQLQSRGWNVAEHSEFGGTSDVHAPNSYHNYDEAIDITWKNNQYGDFDPSGKIGWQEWTKQLGERLQGAGPEVLHQGNDPNHSTHVHLAAKDGVLQLTAGQMNDFGFMMDGKPIVAQPQEENRATAKKKAQDYSNMSKSQMNSAYDAMRDKPNASKEGMKMHEAYFNKPKTVLS